MPKSFVQESFNYPGLFLRKTFDNQGRISQYDLWVTEGTTARVTISQTGATVADVTFLTPPENTATAQVAAPAGFVPPAPTQGASPYNGAVSWHWSIPINPPVVTDNVYQESTGSYPTTRS